MIVLIVTGEHASFKCFYCKEQFKKGELYLSMRNDHKLVKFHCDCAIRYLLEVMNEESSTRRISVSELANLLYKSS